MLTTSYPSRRDPIAGLFVRTLESRLRAEGHIVEVVAAPPGPQGLPEQFAVDPVAALARVVGAAGRLGVQGARAARRLGPRAHLVGHWLLPGGVCAQWAARWVGVTATTIVHSSAGRAAAALPTALAEAVLRAGVGPGPWIASCQDVADVVMGRAPELAGRMRVLTMPVPAPRRSGAPPAGPPWRLLTMGRLVPIKGIDVLIRACEGFPVSLHICGDGPARRDLEALAARVEVHATFHGMVLGEEKAQLLSMSHGFVQPSRQIGVRQEGSPVSLAEGLSYGLPALVTSTGGLPDAVAGSPHIVASPDAAGVRSAMPGFLALLEEHWQRRGIAVG